MTTRTVQEFEFEALGIDYPSYFQGAGVAFTPWDACYVGIGRSEREAAEDAAEGLATDDVALDDRIDAAIDAAVGEFPDVDLIDAVEQEAMEASGVDPDDPSAADEFLADSSELAYVYVVLYVGFASTDRGGSIDE